MKVIVMIMMLLTLLSCSGQKKPKAKFESISFDFGTKKRTDTIRAEFLVINIGGDGLRIDSVASDCSCTVPSFTKGSIKAGQSGKITILYFPKPSDSGPVRREVIVRTNSAKELDVLDLKGQVN